MENMKEIYLDEEDEDDVDGNLYDVGRYRYTRSSEDRDAMMGENASFISACNRWFESFGCGYTCERDGRASMEADDWDLTDFHYEHPLVNCKEAFFELTYGNTEDSVSRAFFFLQEYVGQKNRTFDFCLYDISLQEADDYIAAIEKWHCTGEFNIGPYSGLPAYTPWRQHQ